MIIAEEKIKKISEKINDLKEAVSLIEISRKIFINKLALFKSQNNTMDKESINNQINKLYADYNESLELIKQYIRSLNINK